MQRISQSTFFYKQVFPALWFGFIVFFVCVALFASPRQPALLPAIIVPIVMAIFGYLLFKKLLFDLADEVLDEGDFLVMRFGRDSDRIPLANIMNIGYTIMMNPPRVTLTFAAAQPLWQRSILLACGCGARNRAPCFYGM